MALPAQPLLSSAVIHLVIMLIYVDVQFSIVATANDHADCVDDEEAHANKLFFRHHSKAGKSKKTFDQEEASQPRSAIRRM